MFLVGTAMLTFGMHGFVRHVCWNKEYERKGAMAFRVKLVWTILYEGNLSEAFCIWDIYFYEHKYRSILKQGLIYMIA